jgi:hypothetical protein
MRRAITMTCATAALVVSGGTAASAAAPDQQVFPLVCDGTSYDVVVNGNGNFTPARLLDSTGVLVPTAFGETTFTAVLPDGSVVTDTAPPSAKGLGNVEAHNPRPTVTCTFSVSQTLTEPEEGLPAGTVVTFAGEVTVMPTGRP